MNKKKILIGCSVVLAIFLVIAGYYAYHIKRGFDELARIKPPAGLEEPGVPVGQGLFEKASFLHAKQLRRIGTIVYGRFHAGHEPELCVIGEAGAIFLDEQRNQTDSVKFDKTVDIVLGTKVEGGPWRSGQIDLVDVDGGQTYQFLVHNGGRRGAELIDHDGRSVWAYKASDGDTSSLMDLTSGDIDGDGRAEYVAAYSSGKGLVLLDHSLNEIWSKPEVDANTVAMVDRDGGGKMKILHNDHNKYLFLRDASGNIISGGETGHYIWRFSLVRWPSQKDRQYALDLSDEVLRLLDFNGKTVKEFKAPLSRALSYVYAVPVKLKPDEPEYFAAIADSGGYNRSVLYVYNSTGDMVYQEILPADYASIAAYSIDNTGQEAILLGGEGEVIQYKMNIAPTSTAAQ